MYKLVFFVPESHLEIVKSAVFSAGAGAIGHYDQCCWQVLGQGQFRPLTKSNPYIGKSHELSTVPEYRVEMVCEDAFIQSAVKALRQSHPYEMPAIDVWKLEEF